MNQIQRIAKNIGMSGIAQILVSLLGFFLLIYIARSLGETQYGEYSFALSFSALFVVFADIGINQFIIREIARNKELTSDYIANASVIKFILFFVTFGLIALTINLMNYPQDTINIVYLFGIYTILLSFAQMYMAIFQAFEKMEYTALVMVIEKILLIPIILYIVSQGYGLVEIAYAYAFVGIIDVIVSFLIISTKIRKPALKIDFSIWKYLIKTSIPFGLNSLFAVFFLKVDTVLLSILKGNTAVGIYNAAYTPLLTLSTVISDMVVSAIYPVMSRHFISSRDSLKTFTILISKYMAIIGFPISVGCFILANRFITLFYADQYSESVIAFQILALFIPIRLVSIIAGTLLTSINKQGVRTFSMCISAIFNIVLNIILIPYLSFIGATIATILSEIFLYFSFLYFISKYYEKLEIHKQFIKPLVASLVMGIIVFYFKGINLFILIILASLVYLSMLFLLKTFTEEDRYIIDQLIKRGLKNGK